MADLAIEPHKSCAIVAHSAMAGMVISGRASRACDVCGTERARWYCAADMAYLCQHCDEAVHSANSVAGRHERARLGPDGNPVRPAQASAWAAEVKQEAAAAAHLLPTHSSSPHFNPHKRPRSIRRHKPSSFRASKHVFSAFNSRNHDHLQSAASDSNNYIGSILASTHGVMIDNPRSNPDFIANISGDELLNKSLTVKAEPCTPIAVGDLVKVPDYIDADDQLLESLFDFRDLQDDGHFLHQVPVYNPLQFSQDRTPAGELDYDEKSSIITLSSIPSVSLLPESNQCRNDQSRELFKTEESEGTSSAGSADMHDGAQPCRNSSVKDGIIEPTGDVCDLDQLDFDCVLERNEEDSDERSHAPSDMGVAIHSHDCLDPCSDHAVGVDDSGCTGFSYDSCIDYTMDDVDAQYDCECSGADVKIDFDLSGHESPPNWQCNMKVESPSELGVEDMSGCLDDEHDEASLKEKLINCKASLLDSSHLNFRLGLELNFEDVLISWSDRGSFWIDGHAPTDVANCLDFLGGFFVPHMNGTDAEERSAQQQLNASLKIKRDDGGAREASVLRYREKRHTRLFSKKIRYEVRKLNAEKRPRMKGRFVKRIVVM